MDVPPTFGEWRREVVSDAVMLPRLYLAFRSPVFGSDVYYAASVCGAILGMRRGSRLQRVLYNPEPCANPGGRADYPFFPRTDGSTYQSCERPSSLRPVPAKSTSSS